MSRVPERTGLRGGRSRAAWLGAFLATVLVAPGCGAPSLGPQRSAVVDSRPAGYPGPAANERPALVIVTRRGDSTPLRAIPAPVLDLRVSPSGREVLMSLEPDDGVPELWSLDLTSDGLELQDLGEQGSLAPLRAPDERSLLFTSRSGEVSELVRRLVAPSGQREVLARAERLLVATDWSRDGRYAIVQRFNSMTDRDLLVLDLEEGRIQPFAASELDERQGALAPHGRWVAYVSNRSARDQIFVRPFPTGDGEWQITFEGGDSPQWSSDGTEVCYRGEDGNVRVVSVDPSELSVRIGRSRPLFEDRFLRAPGNAWDVLPDGRFLMLSTPARDDEPRGGEPRSDEFRSDKSRGEEDKETNE